MSRWVSIEDIEDVYGYSKESTYTQIYTNTVMPESAICRDCDGVKIDSLWLDKYEARKRHYINLSHDLYYKAMTIFKTEGALGRWLSSLSPIGAGSWSSFMSKQLFTLRLEPEYTVTMTRTRYQFITVVRWILAIRRRYVIKRGYLR